jgi:hypothetical protein
MPAGKALKGSNTTMKQIRLLGLALMAIFAVSIAATTAAQAVTLEILPAKAKFTFESKAGEATILRTLGGKKVECEKVTGTAEATSARLGPVEFKFVGCKEPATSVSCTGLEDAESGHITVKAEFHIRHLLNGAANGVSLMILVGHVHFTCLIILFLVLGSVCSDDILNMSGGEPADNKLLSSFFVSFLDSGTLEKPTGDPKVTEVDTDNSLEMAKCELLTKEGTSAEKLYETSSQLGSGTMKPTTGTALIDLSGTK